MDGERSRRIGAALRLLPPDCNESACLVLMQPLLYAAAHAHLCMSEVIGVLAGEYDAASRTIT